MGNTTTKMLKTRKDKPIKNNTPPPISEMTLWKKNMQTFMQSHITQLQNYSQSDLQFIKHRLQRLEDRHPVPYRSFDDERFVNALEEISYIMNNIGNWHVMQDRVRDLVNWYINQHRQDDLEEIAYIFCILVIEPQIIKSETTWSWDTI